MIQFACMCGHAFSFPDGRAGDAVQCPRCGVLSDVPTLGELAGMDEDGSIRFEDDEPADPGMTAAEMFRVYTRRTTHPDGTERDQRNPVETLDRIGMAVEGIAPPPKAAPRYDPVTGELIRAFAIKDERPADVVLLDEDGLELAPPAPVRAGRRRVPEAAVPPPPRDDGRPPSLAYATGEARRELTLRTMPVLMLEPGNATVLAFVAAATFAAYLALLPLNTFAIVLGVPPAAFVLLNLPLLVVVAHYGCAVEEAGPEGRDELPRPMRDFAFGDDLFVPLFRVGLALAICFGPAGIAAWVTQMASPAGAAVTLALGVAGAYFFPAVLLIALTGTTVLNLAPGRVWGTIAAVGSPYLASVLLGLVSVLLIVGVILGPACFTSLGRFEFLTYAHVRLAVLLPTALASPFVTHLFCWHLGLIYREHHDRFPWLAQRHTPTPREVKFVAGVATPARPAVVPTDPAARAAAARRAALNARAAHRS